MFLNYWKHVYTPTLTKNVVEGVHAHILPDVFQGLSSGFVYPPLKIAKKVVIDDLPEPNGRCAFILAGGNAHFAGLPSSFVTHSALDYDYKIQAFTLTQIIAHQQATNYECISHISVDHSACASSLVVLERVEYLLSKGFERVIVLALEDSVSAYSIDFFKQSGIVSRETPSAFDDINLGFNLGQGAITVVFEKQPRENCLARLLDISCASENNTNSLGMREDGEGYIRAMQGLNQELIKDVRIVKTHGSGTPTNNIAEKRALLDFLPNGFVATSYKPSIGHTMGVSGLLETVLLLEGIKHDDMVPAIANRTCADDVYDSFLSEPVKAPNGLVLSLASGMGNIYASSLWEIFCD